MPVSGAYRFTYWREPDTEKRCAAMHPGFPSTRCNRTSGHDGEHSYTSPADGRSVEWSDDPEWDETPFEPNRKKKIAANGANTAKEKKRLGTAQVAHRHKHKGRR